MVPQLHPQEDSTTTPTKSTPTKPASADENGNGAQPASGGDPATSDSTATLDRLVRAQEDLAQEIRQLAVHQALEPGADHEDDTERAGRLLTIARTQLLEELQEQEQERSRRQLADAARNGEEAADGVVRGVTTIVRTIVPAALVRPEDLVDAAFTLADQGLRVSRRLALSISGSVRSLTASV